MSLDIQSKKKRKTLTGNSSQSREFSYIEPLRSKKPFVWSYSFPSPLPIPPSPKTTTPTHLPRLNPVVKTAQPSKANPQRILKTLLPTISNPKKPPKQARFNLPCIHHERVFLREMKNLLRVKMINRYITFYTTLPYTCGMFLDTLEALPCLALPIHSAMPFFVQRSRRIDSACMHAARAYMHA